MEIIYEDNHLIAVNKRVSDIVQGDKTGDKPLSEMAKTYLKEKYHKRWNVFLGVVHRIDRPVSGVVLFARTSKALSRLNEMMKKHQIRKTYWAIVKNRPTAPCGSLTHYLVHNPAKNISVAHDKEVPNSQLATLSYRVIGEVNGFFVLEIDLQTGRHHQIRSQLAKIGSPIVGDVKYGYPVPDRDAGIHLHSRKMELMHPVSKLPVSIVAPAPKDPLWDAFMDKYKNA
ncbi:MAG: RNA pseudouridine synthase [Candidatus Pacebacteria bacterium]|jgi:23S rRNA pseudouridine1911/1915/1917 synthase|nr:RNA pseudouridine synthase [Candidatus Paceibacterota bacterium]